MGILPRYNKLWVDDPRPVKVWVNYQFSLSHDKYYHLLASFDHKLDQGGREGEPQSVDVISRGGCSSGAMVGSLGGVRLRWSSSCVRQRWW